MAFGWDDLILLAGTAYGASASDKAAGKAVKGGKNAIAEQQRQYNTALTMLEPQRALGYGALEDIANIYGYRLPSYTPLSSVASGTVGGTTSAPGGVSNWMVGAPIGIGGRKAPGSTAGIDNNPFSGGAKRFGGAIDPVTGQVTVNAKKNQIEKNAAATAYLRGESGELGGAKFKRIRRAIDDLKGQGWTWSNLPAAPTAGVIPGGTTGSSPDGTAGNFGRFFTSPDYQFRLGEGNKAIERSAAARGNVLAPNTVKALTDYSGNLASSEWGNYMNRLFNIAGMGQTATTQGIGVGQNTANNTSNAMLGIGDARASGVLGQANTWMNGTNALMNNYLLKRGGWYDRPAGT